MCGCVVKLHKTLRTQMYVKYLTTEKLKRLKHNFPRPPSASIEYQLDQSCLKGPAMLGTPSGLWKDFCILRQIYAAWCSQCAFLNCHWLARCYFTRRHGLPGRTASSRSTHSERMTATRRLTGAPQHHSGSNKS